jgi:hypothetical protein
MSEEYIDKAGGALNGWINDARDGHISKNPKTVKLIMDICEEIRHAVDQDLADLKAENARLLRENNRLHRLYES